LGSWSSSSQQQVLHQKKVKEVEKTKYGLIEKREKTEVDNKAKK
jgi:hypothetical protein